MNKTNVSNEELITKAFEKIDKQLVKGCVKHSNYLVKLKTLAKVSLLKILSVSLLTIVIAKLNKGILKLAYSLIISDNIPNLLVLIF